ncbi:MAG: sigma-54-dependent Fis family transcriptional regulator [Rhodothermia bacterium]|nr:sigma-54-dependent Fis family transcriptional regulator [Rhodothermia bacterium]
MATLKHLLIVDDERAIRRTLREILEFEGYAIDEAEDGVAALEKMRKGRYDMALLDIKMPKMDGLEVLKTIASEQPELPIVMISGHGNVETAVESTRLGAVDFLEKPPDLNRLLVTIRNALVRGKLVVENKRMKQTLVEQQHAGVTPIIGDSKPIQLIKKTIERVAPTEARVLVTGEPGTGKELVARWLHKLSRRAEAPLIEVNCAAIPSELIESELFGHEKGSFTGAHDRKLGKFEQANGGTLFLDEIGDMSLPAQAKMLRALQEGIITRVGGDRAISVDVRVVAATNKDLNEAIREKSFRQDLFDRLNVIPIHVPPLRERREDIPAIATFVLEKQAARNRMTNKSFSPKAMTLMRQYDWRGNIRELYNVVERLLILSNADQIEAEDVEHFVTPYSVQKDAIGGLLERYNDFAEFRDAAEKLFIERKLNQFDWNISKTAEEIGIQRSHLYNKISKYGIERAQD